MSRAVAGVCFVLALVAVGALVVLVNAINTVLGGLYD